MALNFLMRNLVSKFATESWETCVWPVGFVEKSHGL